jgi:hypothetical protein
VCQEAALQYTILAAFDSIQYICEFIMLSISTYHSVVVSAVNPVGHVPIVRLSVSSSYAGEINSEEE